MSRKRSDRRTFAEIVAEVRSAPARARIPRVPRSNPLQAGQLMLLGRCWQLRDTQLDSDRTFELLTSAAEVVVAEGGGFVVRIMEERAEIAEVLRRRLCADGSEIVGPPWPEEPTYTAHEFTDDDHRLLLYIDTDC